MVIYEENTKRIVVPSGLGNLTGLMEAEAQAMYTSGRTDGYNEGVEDGKSIQDNKLTESVTFNENGEYDADYGYKKVIVDVDKQWDEGFEVGYESGNTDGYASGYTDGYTSGYTDGQASCPECSGSTDCSSAITEAFESGYTAGYNSGYTTGQEECEGGCDDYLECHTTVFFAEDTVIPAPSVGVGNYIIFNLDMAYTFVYGAEEWEHDGETLYSLIFNEVTLPAGTYNFRSVIKQNGEWYSNDMGGMVFAPNDTIPGGVIGSRFYFNESEQ